MNAAPHESKPSLLAGIGGVATGYYLSGKLGLLLAIPPGYATALWPPAGIALASLLLLGYRVWPGILLGSFLVNISTSFDSSTGALVAKSIAIAATIGLGAVLQALLGAFLVRRCVGLPLELVRDRHVVLFLLLGGPASCVTGASIGVATLALVGLVQAGQWPFHWWTWWVGDSIGVAVIAPLLLIALGQPRDVWRRRWTTVALPLGIMLGLVTALFLWISSWEEARMRIRFEEDVRVLQDGTRKRLEEAVEVLHSLGSFHEAGTPINPTTFRSLVDRSLSRGLGIQALSWDERVLDADRKAFEKAWLEAEGGITELDDQGRKVSAAHRQEYCPILCIEPFGGNATALGFDVASDPQRREALQRACDTDAPVATQRLQLIQEKGSQFGVIVYFPVYSKAAGVRSVKERRQTLQGYFAGVFRLGDFFAAAGDEARRLGIDISVLDRQAPAGQRLIWRSSTGSTGELDPQVEGSVDRPETYSYSTALPVASRVWSMSFRATPAYVSDIRSWRPWTVLAAGMLLSGLLGAFLLSTTGRGVAIERLGAERTEALSKNNADLEAEVAERRRAEEALRRSEGTFQLILNSALDAIISINSVGRVISWNPQAERIFGWRSEEVMGLLLSELIIPTGQREAHEKGLKRFLATGAGPILNRRVELAAVARDGTVLPIELAVVPARRGEEVFFTAFIRDLREEKAAQERFEATFEQAAVGIGHVDPNGRCLRANQKLCDILGYSREELLAISFQTLTPPEDLEPDREYARKVLEGEIRTYAIEKRYVRKDRSVAWVNLTVSLVRRPDGSPDYFIRVVEDISRRKVTEEALRESEARLRRIVESDMIGILFWDVEGNILDANDTFLRMVGYTREDLRSGLLRWKDLTPPEYAELDVRAIDQLQRTGTATPFEKEYIRKDGRRIAILLGAALFEGKRDQGVCFVLDITFSKTLEGQLRQAQRMEVIGRLAGGVAHDFNNLLTPIMGYAELIRNALGPEDRLREEVEEIQKSAERAAGLTRQLLAFSRKQMLQPKVLDLNDTVAEIQKLLCRLIGEDVSLVLVLTPGIGRVKVDPGQLEQVIMNLSVNARDAMPLGGKLTIETGNAELDQDYARRHLDVAPGSYVALSVSDTGLGMDKTTMSHLFEPFFTTKAQGKGTGLGLATVYGVVKQSHGHIFVYSESGRGTTFRLYFPRVEEEVERVQESVRPAVSDRGTETVLLVEDDASLRTFAAKVLRHNGYFVLEAGRGEEALVIAKSHPDPIDVLLTDVVMPGMSGRELAKLIVSSRPNVRVLYMSGYTENAIVHHGVLDEGTTLLEKPFTPDILVRKLRKVLDRHTGPGRQENS